MEDIARAAGISRPNLYNFFENKEALFVGSSTQLLVSSLDHAAAGLAREGDVWERLTAAFEGWVMEHMALVRDSAHANELLDAASDVAGALLASYYARFTELLTRALRQAVKRGELDLAGAGLSAAGVADLLVSASNGFKNGDVSPALYRKRLRLLLATLKRATTPSG